MSINGISSSTHSLPQAQHPAQVKKNDHDGDEVNGADPANEKAKETAQATTRQSSSNPYLGGKLDQTT